MLLRGFSCILIPVLVSAGLGADKRRHADVKRGSASCAAAHGALRAAAAAAAARSAAPVLLRSHRRQAHLRPVRGLLEQLQPQVGPRNPR